MEGSIFNKKPLTARDFIDWLKTVEPDVIFDVLRPQGCLLALFFKAQLGGRFFTAQQTYAVIDGQNHPYGVTWVKQVADVERQFIGGSGRFGLPVSAAASVPVRVGTIRGRLIAILSEFG